MQPLNDIHLKSDIIGEFEANGNITYIYIFSITAIFVLLIACVNFMNLTTAKSANRTKEIGLRKVVGSVKKQILIQFLGESVILSLIAFCLSILIIIIILPAFNNLVEKQFSLNLLSNPKVFLFLLGLVVSVGLVSGSYPAFYLSSLKPVSIITGKFREGKKNSTLRGVLVVFQFSVTIALFIGTYIVNRQVEYFQNKKLGFNKEQIIVVKNAKSLENNKQAFKDALTNYSGIASVSGSYSLPGGHFVNYGFRPENSDLMLLNFGICDPEFLNTLQLEMKMGRFFSREFPADSTAIIINETAVTHLNWDEPIGKRFTSLGRTFNIIGVVKDFHYESLHQTVKPMALLNLSLHLDWPESFISIRTVGSNISETLEFIDREWQTFSRGKPFEYSFFDEDYNNFYKNEIQTGKVFKIFSLLSIFIACLGLYGLASFTTEQRTKEIGIRKALGASVHRIIFLLSKDFLKWIVLANLIAWPVAYLLMDRWLQNFAYRINVEFLYFYLSAILAAVVSILVVGYHTFRAARANPVESLRYE